MSCQEFTVNAPGDPVDNTLYKIYNYKTYHSSLQLVGPSHGFTGADDYFHHKPAKRSELVT